MSDEQPTIELPEFKDDITGEVRKLGTLRPTKEALDRMRRLMRAVAPVSPEAWQEFEHDAGPIKIKDQDGIGACNGFAKATVEEWVRKIMRMDHVDLSGWFPYAIMCNGRDQGSMIEDAIELGRTTGNCREELVPYGTYNPRKLTREAYADALNYRIEMGEFLTDWDDMMSATQRFSPFNFSVRVGSNFNDLDEEGVCGVSRGVGNHAVTGGLGARRLSKGRYKGQWAIKCQNSWSTRWGKGGYFWVVENHFTNQSYFQAYTVYAVRGVAA